MTHVVSHQTFLCCLEEGVPGGSDVAHRRHVCGVSARCVSYVVLAARA